MADFQATVASNGPQVKDVDSVEEIIARYVIDPDFHVGVNYDHDTGEPYLFMYGFAWPEAWRIPGGMTADEFDPYTEENYPVGADGFSQLLKELARHLKEPLTVHAIGLTPCRFPLAAAEWHVGVGSKKVKLTEFRHGYRESIVV